MLLGEIVMPGGVEYYGNHEARVTDPRSATVADRESKKDDMETLLKDAEFVYSRVYAVEAAKSKAMEDAGVTTPDTESSIKAKLRRRKATERLSTQREEQERLPPWSLEEEDPVDSEVNSELQRDRAVAEAMANRNSRPQIGHIAQSRALSEEQQSQANVVSPFAHQSQSYHGEGYRTPQSLRAPVPPPPRSGEGPKVGSRFVTNFAKRHGMSGAFSPGPRSARRRTPTHGRRLSTGSFDRADENGDGIIDRREWQNSRA